MSSDGPAEVVTFGEAMIRLGVAPGEQLEDARSLSVVVGGAEANVAVAVARMGHRASWFSRLPDSPLGRRIASDLRSNGVDVSHVEWVSEGRVGTYYYEPEVMPRPGRVTYDRSGSTVCELTVENMPWSLFSAARVVHLTGITPALSESLKQISLEAAKRVKQRTGSMLCVDLNYRARLWDPDIARPIMTELCTGADIVILAAVDVRRVFKNESPPDVAAADLQNQFGAKALIVTRGAEGAVWRIGSKAGASSAIPALEVDRLGTGDAFAAGVIVGALEDDLELGIRLGTAMAALKLGSHGDQFRGVRADVDDVLAGLSTGLVR